MKIITLKYFLISTLLIFWLNVAVAENAKIHLNPIQEKLAQLEASSNGKIGVSAFNMGNSSTIQYREKEPFHFQSTFKAMLAAAILKERMKNPHLLQQKLTYTKKDIVFWSPITKQHLLNTTGEMSIFDLCAAAIMYSDNAATNLLVKKLGGPKAMNGFMHSIGNNVFRLDNWEPELNSNPDNLQDTSTAEATTKSLQDLAFGKVLSSSQRQQLINWMKGNTTGNNRIRAGVPKDWVVADKTGSGEYGITNDIGIIMPPHCAPIIVSLYFTQNNKEATPREEVIATATRLLIQEFARTDQCMKKTGFTKNEDFG